MLYDFYLRLNLEIRKRQIQIKVYSSTNNGKLIKLLQRTNDTKRLKHDDDSSTKRTYYDDSMTTYNEKND